jgi:SAM-dependent methyltransferase
MKDNFSLQSKYYSKFRPDYPDELYDIIFKQVSHFGKAWDCATGNGQVAKLLSRYFESVEATDISEQQLMRAVPGKNIRYQVMPAELTSFNEDTFDLITVGQALHWFDFSTFFQEAARVLKKGGILAVWCYGINKIDPDIDPIVLDFYHNLLGKYWDSERNLVDNRYCDIPFPNWNWKTHHLEHTVFWDKQHYLGYLNSWSAVQKYIGIKHKNPVDIIDLDLQMKWGEGKRPVIFPLTLFIADITSHV